MNKKQFLREHGQHYMCHLFNGEILYVIQMIVNRKDICDEKKINRIGMFIGNSCTVSYAVLEC